ncbi:hypothetical protein J6590_105042, partial [Homalodisca vitripennis]
MLASVNQRTIYKVRHSVASYNRLTESEGSWRISPQPSHHEQPAPYPLPNVATT